MALIDDESKWMHGKEYEDENHACIKCGVAPCDCGGLSEFVSDPCCWGCSTCHELDVEELDYDESEGDEE